MCPGPCTTSTKWQYNQAREIERAKTVLLRAGYGLITPPWLNLLRAGSLLRVNFGVKVPRLMTFIVKIEGLSPGRITLWHDAESGWFTEARVRTGASPVYHHVDDDTAIAILKGNLTKELEVELMKPDEYLGE